jgi:hypothetical protein
MLTWDTGAMVPSKALELIDSNLARVIWLLKSSPSNRESISTVVEVPLLKAERRVSLCSGECWRGSGTYCA